jgi:hypothetical protein
MARPTHHPPARAHGGPRVARAARWGITLAWLASLSWAGPMARAWPQDGDAPAHASPDTTNDPQLALDDAMALLRTLEHRSLELASQGHDIVALLGILDAGQVARVNEAANRVLAAALESGKALGAALRAIPPATPVAPHPAELADAIARSEDAFRVLVPLRAARATLAKAQLIEDRAVRDDLVRQARAALLPVETSAPWAAMERSVLLAIADAHLGQGRAALEHLLDARAALSADPRLADPTLRLTLQLAGASVLATLAEAGPDAALSALQRVAGRPPFAPDPDTRARGVDPFARLLLADLNARIELDRLDSAGGMTHATPAFRQRVLDAIAQGYARAIDEPGLRDHREAVRLLSYQRLATIVPESLPIEELPILAALARVAAHQQRMHQTTDPDEQRAIAAAVVAQLEAIASRDDAEARALRGDLLYDLAAAAHRAGDHATAARHLLRFAAVRPDDDRAGAAVAHAMDLAERAGSRELALEAGWLAHRAPFEVPGRDAIRLRLLRALLDGQAYRDPLDPARYDVRRYFASLLVEADRVASSINRSGPHGLALRQALVAGDAWALALAERFPDELAALELTTAAVAGQAERRATDLLTYEPSGDRQWLSDLDRARVLAHRARAWLLQGRPLDALTDADLALQSLHQHHASTGVLDQDAQEDVLALLIHAAAHARQHERARVALERALARSAESREHVGRLIAILTTLQRDTEATLDRLDRDFPADPHTVHSPVDLETLRWLPERTAFLLEAASELDPAGRGWHAALRLLHARAAMLGRDHETALAALDQVHRAAPATVASTLLLGEAQLLAGNDAAAFAAFGRVIAALDGAAPDPSADGSSDDPNAADAATQRTALWRAWARAVEILARQAEHDPTGRRAASAQRQIRRLRLRSDYHACPACAAKIEAAAAALGVDRPRSP